MPDMKIYSRATIIKIGCTDTYLWIQRLEIDSSINGNLIGKGESFNSVGKL